MINSQFFLRFAVLMIGCVGFLANISLAEDRAAFMRMQQWKEAISSNPRMAVQFQTKRINSIFQTVEERSGVFYRDEHGNAVFRMGEYIDRPLSAVEDVNALVTRVYNYDEPGMVCAWDDWSLGVDLGKYPRLVSYRPPSALYPENAPAFFRWSFNTAFSQADVFPLMFAESPEIGWYDAKLITNPKSADVCLRLSRLPDIPSDRAKSVDALFRPGESFPFAVRQFDGAGSIEFRYFIDSIQTGEQAQIPDDAFSRATSN